MTDNLYLHQSRRLAKILRNMFGTQSHWTNYYAWEYNLPNNIKLEILYTPSYGYCRFEIYTHRPTYTKLLSTNSLKEIITYLRNN